jgi:hypothetical protein
MKDNPIVVVPWDFSAYAAQSLAYSLELTTPENVRVICVLDEPAMDVGSGLVEYDAAVAAEACQESFFRAVGPELQKLRFAACCGQPAREITDFVREVHADMIVMATHGKTGLKRLLLGSVAEGVLRSANCPVLILPRKWVENRTGDKRKRTTANQVG